MKRLVYLIILSTCLLESKAQKVSIELLKSAKWELTSPDYSSYRHTTFQFTDSQLKETIYYKKDKKTLSACNSYYLADTKTEYFDDQQVGKKSRGRYIIQKRYDGKAVCKEVVSASANEIQLKNRLGAILVWKKKEGVSLTYDTLFFLFVIYISAFSSCISSADSPVISKTVASFIPFASIFLAISKFRWVMPFSMPSAIPSRLAVSTEFLMSR